MSGVGAMAYPGVQGGSGGGSGAPAPTGLDVQTVTVGGDGAAYPTFTRRRGFISATFGTISTGNSALYASAAIAWLYWNENGGAPYDFVQLKITGTGLANSGWVQVKIGSYILSRASATYFTSGGFTYWEWDGPGGNPFPLSSTVTAAFS